MSFEPSNSYLINSTIYNIFVEEDQTKKQYLLQQLKFHNECQYYAEQCEYNINMNLPLPIPPIKPELI